MKRKHNPVVSIRVPKSLVDEFKQTAEKDHFLDVSDAFRTIIRDKMLEEKDPYLNQVKKLRKDIKQNIAKDEFGKEKLIEELEKIKDELLRGDL